MSESMPSSWAETRFSALGATTCRRSGAPRRCRLLAQSGLSETSARLSAFGAKQTCRHRGPHIQRSLMTRSGSWVGQNAVMHNIARNQDVIGFRPQRGGSRARRVLTRPNRFREAWSGFRKGRTPRIQNDSGLSQGLAGSPCGRLEARRGDGAGNKWRYERIGGLPWLSRAT
jgi:hypothetical protein